MPRFYLHQRLGSRLVEDPEGSELPDLAAARDEAIVAARDFWAEAIVAGCDLSDRAFAIADADGTHLLVVSFVDALPDSLRIRLLANDR